MTPLADVGQGASWHRSAIVASPAFFARHATPAAPDDLRQLPCIRLRFASGRTYAWEFERDGTELAVEVEGPLTLNDQGLMIEAALDGAGIAFALLRAFLDFVRPAPR